MADVAGLIWEDAKSARDDEVIVLRCMLVLLIRSVHLSISGIHYVCCSWHDTLRERVP